MTKDKFAAYVHVQQSGLTNMLNARAVVRLSGYKLTEDEVFDIIANFDSYIDQWPDLVCVQ